MPKRLKRKRRACGLCKSYKRGWANRWKPKEFARLKEAKPRFGQEEAQNCELPLKR